MRPLAGDWQWGGRGAPLALIVVSACGCLYGHMSHLSSASPVCPLHSSSSSLGQPLPYIPCSYLIPPDPRLVPFPCMPPPRLGQIPAIGNLWAVSISCFSSTSTSVAGSAYSVSSIETTWQKFFFFSPGPQLAQQLTLKMFKVYGS